MNIDKELREELAESEHARWSRWMTYLFRQCDNGPYGSMIIPGKFADRWKRQTLTNYADLSEQEKDSDRAEADRTIAIMMAWLKRVRAGE